MVLEAEGMVTPSDRLNAAEAAAGWQRCHDEAQAQGRVIAPKPHEIFFTWYAGTAVPKTSAGAQGSDAGEWDDLSEDADDSSEASEMDD
jgi:hypothetical protein